MLSSYRSRGYQEAVVALNSLQSNASVLAAIQSAGPQPSQQIFGQTNYYLRRAGYRVTYYSIHRFHPSHFLPSNAHLSPELVE